MNSLTPLEYILIVSTLLEFNPLFQMVKSIRTKNVEGVSLFTFLSITAIGGLWLYYGISIASVPLIVGNSIKLFASFSVVCAYFYFRKRKDE